MYTVYIESLPTQVKELMLDHQEDFVGIRDITKFYENPTIPRDRFLWDHVSSSQAWRLILDVPLAANGEQDNENFNIESKSLGLKILFDDLYE